MSVEMITVSSKGQVVLPATIRKSLSISGGDRLAVHLSDGVIFLKPVKSPTAKDFEQWIYEAKAWSKSVGAVEVPRTMDLMTEEELNQKISHSLSQIEEGKAIPMEDAFDLILEGLEE